MRKLLCILLSSIAVTLTIAGCVSEQENMQEVTENPLFVDPVSEDDITKSTTEEPTTELHTTMPKLHDECDKVLATGYDADNNYYELVANETENYDGTKITFGVIKNNVWSLKMGSHTPFLDENGLLLGEGNSAKSIYDIDSEVSIHQFKYMGNGCFYFRENILNGNNGKYFVPDEKEGFSYIAKGIGKHGDIFICNENKVMVRYENDKGMCKVLNTDTMKISDVNLDIESNINYLFPYSDGLFACVCKDKNENGFYDLSGKKIIDLSEYNIYSTSATNDFLVEQRLVFQYGNCTFKIWNDQRTPYIITIDKTGKVIESKEDYSNN